jgi:hypothetical protein
MLVNVGLTGGAPARGHATSARLIDLAAGGV